MKRLHAAAAALSLCLLASCGQSKADALADTMEEVVVLLEGVNSSSDAEAARTQFASLQVDLMTKTMELVKDGRKGVEGDDVVRLQQLKTRMELVQERISESPELMAALGGGALPSYQ